MRASCAVTQSLEANTMDLTELSNAAKTVTADSSQVIAAARTNESKIVALFDSYKAILLGFMVASFALGAYVGHLIGSRV
jgi:hypothetical protein